MDHSFAQSSGCIFPSGIKMMKRIRMRDNLLLVAFSFVEFTLTLFFPLSFLLEDVARDEDVM